MVKSKKPPAHSSGPKSQQSKTRQQGDKDHRSREQRLYAHPVADRSQILQHLRKEGVPQTLEALETALRVKTAEQREGFERRLAAMVRDGQLLRNRRGQFILVNARDLIKGRIAGHPDGFGFLEPDEGDSLTLDGRQMRQVMHGDIAVARVAGIDHRGRKIGHIVEVIERKSTEIIGRYYQESGVQYIVPENRKIAQQILVAPSSNLSVTNGQIAIVRIKEFPTLYRYAIGEITEVLGEYGQSGMEIDVAARVFGIPIDWPEDVDESIAHLGDEVLEEDKVGREDLRNLPLLTIDGADARDFDDAVYCKKTATGWRLWVAIADVSHYAQPESPLDKEAFKRGTSVYFPDSVVPMFPEKLSNGLCSLNPNVDRLCMVCEMSISANGETRRARFYRGVMKSVARLTYEQVWDVLSDDEPQCDEPPVPETLQPFLHELHALYRALHDGRRKRGSIDFDTVETRVDFDDDRRIKQIVPIVRNDAHRLIEECMIAANVSAAEFLARHKMPTLYRVHPGPKETRLENLYSFLGMLGLSLGTNEVPTPHDYARVLDQIRTRPDFQLIQTVLLRSLSQADYRPENKGHFGLSLETYCHFTSPIRRYPDLLVHRAIGHLIEHRKRAGFDYTTEQMTELGSHCSLTERRAEEATRDAMRALKCRFMMDHVGSEFTGVISGVTAFGAFVELDDIYIEGLVHITELGDDYYRFDPVSHRLVGERAGEGFRLADPIRVRVVRVDLDEKQIDFIRVGGKKTGGNKAGGKKAGGKKAGGKKVFGKKIAGKKIEDKKTNGKKVEGKKVDGKKVVGKKIAGKKIAGKKIAEKNKEKSRKW